MKQTLETQLAGPVTKKVFLVDVHPAFRKGLASLIENEGLSVCGEATSARQALSTLRRVEADLVIVDLCIEGTNGLELIKHLRAEHETLPVLVLSLHDEEIYAMRALWAGANGYVMKREAAETVLAAIREILAGEI